MATIGYAQLLFRGADSPTTPAAIAALAAAADPHLIHHVTNLADRNANFATAPLHTVVSAEDGSLWVKTSGTTNTWATIWEPVPAWVPIPLASGYQASGAYAPEYRKLGSLVHVRGRIEKVDGTVMVGNGPVLATAPTAIRPAQLCSWAGGQSLTGDPVTGVCRIEIASSLVWQSQDGTGGLWIDISGSYWLD